MIDAVALTPLAVAGPLAVGAGMLGVAHFLPPRVSDVTSVLTALVVCVLCASLAAHALHHGPFVYWFGGWKPRPGVTLGIGFGVDPASAAVASFIALIFALSFGFAWGYFDEVKAHFHVLMLLFMAAMVGFVLTRDLFNLFVWFEVMSVAAFALTAYQLETPSLAGALNFTVVNSLASFMMLGGVGLLYARAGALDFEAIGAAVARSGHDPVIAGGFCLLAAALMTKGAIFPFHYWLSDAHAVAPSPVSVIFSGAMVSVALFALAKLTLRIFAPSADAHSLMGGLFMVLGCATAVLGGVMAWLQRQLKRMLAFSTVAHLGIMLTGAASLTSAGVAGLIVYLVGHGLVKGALFMLAGVLLATRASVDELDLRGLGRAGIWPAGVAMALAALLLGGAPWGPLHVGSDLVAAGDDAHGGALAVAAVTFGAALTGAAVLRACGRIFLGLGPDPGEEANAPSQADQEKADRPLWLMMIPIMIMLILAIAPAHLARPLLAPIAHAFAGSPQGGLAAGSLPKSPVWIAWLSTTMSVGIALFALFRQRLPRLLVRPVGSVMGAVVRPLRVLHSGLIPDYVVWMAVGMALFTLALALPPR